eukprot:1162108-Pelagomonas_calceolata.AAC.12
MPFKNAVAKTKFPWLQHVEWCPLGGPRAVRGFEERLPGVWGGQHRSTGDAEQVRLLVGAVQQMRHAHCCTSICQVLKRLPQFPEEPLLAQRQGLPTTGKPPKAAVLSFARRASPCSKAGLAHNRQSSKSRADVKPLLGDKGSLAKALFSTMQKKWAGFTF